MKLKIKEDTEEIMDLIENEDCAYTPVLAALAKFKSEGYREAKEFYQDKPAGWGKVKEK